MKKNIALIGIGSNIDAKRNISLALDELSRIGSVHRVSEVIETKPIGIIDQPLFSNGAVCVAVHFNQNDLKRELKRIEDDLGRDRSRPKYGPREIDLDIVVFNNEVIDDDYHQRSFLKDLIDSIWEKL